MMAPRELRRRHRRRSRSEVTREESGFCCDTGNYDREYDSDALDLMTILAIYRKGDEDTRISMTYTPDRFGEQIDRRETFEISIESGLTGGEYSCTQYTVN